MAVVAESSEVRRVVGPAVADGQDVVDLIGVSAAELAAVGVAVEGLRAELPPGARRAVTRCVRGAARAFRRPSAGDAGLQSHLTRPCWLKSAIGAA